MNNRAIRFILLLFFGYGWVGMLKIKRWLVLVGVSAMITITGCSWMAEITKKSVDTVIKSPADDRGYRHFTLSNGLKVLLISDPDTDKAAAAVDVNVGSYMDPDNRLGLAHFLEHMLFMGTEKYPKVDSYFDFIRANGGSSNAYTTDVRTNYYFNINRGQLEPALDQLAQFFVSPKLDTEYVDRERNAVDSEYRLHAKEDIWRTSLAENVTANPKHPMSRFSIGSLETLNNDNGDLYQDLRRFYKRYYVASNMALVVYGGQSLDQLESMVKVSFSDVPAGNKPDLSMGAEPYRSQDLGVRVNIVPLKDTRILSLSFPTESVQAYYKKKPLGYLLSMIGDEGKGSLHSYLKEQGLIDGLSAYQYDLPGEFTEMDIRLALTEKGLDQVDNITAVVFDYIDLIRKEGLQRRIFDEARKVAELEFRFHEEQSPQLTASGLAARMHYYPARDLLQENYLYESYDPELIRRMLSVFTPQNLRQVVIAKGVSTDQVEPYFDTKYSVKPLSDELIQRLNTPQEHRRLAIPAANEFIATDFKLRSSDSVAQPEILIDEKGLKLWAHTDTSFGAPRGSVNIAVTTKVASETPQAVAESKLYGALLSRSLNEDSYPASVAGLDYGVYMTRRGVDIALSGYQDKQNVLLDNILSAIKTFQPDEAAFQQEKASIIRALKNKEFLTPYRLAFDGLSRVTYLRAPSDESLLKALDALTLKEVMQFSQSLYQNINVEMLVYGNFSHKEAEALASSVERSLLTPTNRGDRFDEPFRLLGDTDLVLDLDITHNDSVFVSYYQMPQTDNRSRAQYALLGRLLGTPFFSSLRTEQQLGYVVFAGPRPVEKHPGLMFVVQSPKLDPIGIEQRVNDFLTQQVTHLKQLTDDELEEYRKGLVGDLLKKDNNLEDRSNRLWGNISSGEYDFNNLKKIAKEIENMKPEDMQEALARVLENKGKLVIRSFGEPHRKAYKKDDNRQECHTISCFKGLSIVK